MASILTIRDGETYAHNELMGQFKFKTERAFKEWICKHDVSYYAIQGVWWIAGEDLRTALRHAAQTHADRNQGEE